MVFAQWFKKTGLYAYIENWYASGFEDSKTSKRVQHIYMVKETVRANASCETLRRTLENPKPNYVPDVLAFERAYGKKLEKVQADMQSYWLNGDNDYHGNDTPQRMSNYVFTAADRRYSGANTFRQVR